MTRVEVRLCSRNRSNLITIHNTFSRHIRSRKLYYILYIPLDEEIDIHALTSLTASMIESMITKIGPRAKFTTKLQEYKNDKASVRYIINIPT